MEAPGRHKLKVSTKIGHGAFGTVYKGTYDGAPCAVKTIADDRTDATDNIACRMFLREAQVLQSCNHRNIIGFKALCRVNADRPSHELSKNAPAGKWAMVVEFAKDGTLCQKVSKQMITPSAKVYTNAQALGWALDVASALEYLHLRSPAIFHRDVKLSNVVLTRSTDGGSGALIAKLSDFGLHVVADNTRNRLVRVSHVATGASRRDLGARPAGPRPLAACIESPGLTSEALAELQQQLHGSEPAPDTSAGKGSCDKDSAWQTHGRAKAGKLAADDHDYSEMHDGLGGRKSFVGGQAAPALLLPLSATRSPDTSGASFSVGAGGAGRGASFSFRRASHHPGGNELVMARVPSMQPPASGDDAAAGAGMQDRSVHWSEYDFDNCSIATDGTYVSGTTPGASDCSSDCDGSTLADMETVFNMTGQTGSSMYMAPEVFLGEPYNEKADVFSLGVVLYELMARCLLIFTELPTCTTDPNAPDRYARKVSEGYRPARPKRMTDGVWQLVEACWQQDPVQRPHMSEVVSVLQALLQAEQSSSLAAASALTQRPASQDSIMGAGPPAGASSSRMASDGYNPGEPAKAGGCCVIA